MMRGFLKKSQRLRFGILVGQSSIRNEVCVCLWHILITFSLLSEEDISWTLCHEQIIDKVPRPSPEIPIRPVA
jgi:hypothetical protein